MERELYKADANPTKDFFIYMITRDIETKAAIVELIDNSIDGARKIRNNGDYSGLKIDISFDKDCFKITDNCGGFDVDTAVKYAFKFGRPGNREKEKGLFTGLFGIGMKRALFKLGNKFTVTSTTKKTHFRVEVDVDEWIKLDDWNLPMYDVVVDGDFDDDECGTSITIEKIHKEQCFLFENKVFENNLFSYIEKYRSVEAENGLAIRVKGKEVSFFKEKLIENVNIKCYRNYLKVGQGEIKVIAGVSHNGTPENAGWYVFCNGRLVLFADKTNVTGWGSEYRAYHPALANFRGYVYFESEELFELPWNTTKTGVDSSNVMYLNALDLMKEAVEQIGRVVNDVKKNYDVSNLDEIEEIKKASEIEINHSVVRGITTGADFSIKPAEVIEKKVTISFSEPEEKYQNVKKYMKAKSKKDIGERLFDYYCEMEGI